MNMKKEVKEILNFNFGPDEATDGKDHWIPVDKFNKYQVGTKEYELKKIINKRLKENGFDLEPTVHFEKPEDVLAYIESLKNKHYN